MHELFSHSLFIYIKQLVRTDFLDLTVLKNALRRVQVVTTSMVYAIMAVPQDGQAIFAIKVILYIYIYTWLMHLVDRLYYFIFIRETSRLGRHILVSVLFWPCLKCNWLIFKWMNGVSLPKMHQCVYYLTSNSCLLSIFFRKKEFNLPPSYN